ncbi:DUF742 domain-containing protein [Streptomyces sp. NBC_01727]|uniref:DUF742 domain-containing protein n=1 Tax=Streptomyces sp. NBC_01727 TaxID=2975924 RepID=UPI002E145A1B|nr:DUF742 domain-containing protein [Streptomyces sp. NBC_01727]
MRRRELPREVPAYLATGGRTRPRQELPDLLTRLVWARVEHDGGLDPPQRQLFDAVRGGSLTLADASVYLRLPPGAIRVLTCDLLDLKLIQVAHPAQTTDVELLEDVLNGLRRLKAVG